MSSSGPGVIAPTSSSRSGTPERLEARDVRVHFSGVKAVDGVDLDLRRDEVMGLIGPNGAGKTTLVNALTGFQRLTTGTITLGAEVVTTASPQALARKGLTRTFQAVRPFAELTVLENIELGAVGTGSRRRAARAAAATIVERVGLAEMASSLAGNLPHGLARRLSIGRALATAPNFLLLDEPAAGLNEAESDELVELISSIHSEDGCGVLVIEHDVRLIMRLCHRIQVLDYGKTIAVGTPTEVQSDAAVITAYLGTKRGRHVAGS
ncbi:MAG: ABC transporter ATP-binding protein [Actinobacteria bacterium]|nr:ABC transporter ATP-binding protein [Actinomycetota bacterium]